MGCCCSKTETDGSSEPIINNEPVAYQRAVTANRLVEPTYQRATSGNARADLLYERPAVQIPKQPVKIVIPFEKYWLEIM